MKVIDCSWELTNISKRTIEIIIEHDDVFDPDSLYDSIYGYEYAVIKVPMNLSSFNLGISAMGFACIETQLSVRKNISDFDTSTEILYDDIDFEIVTTTEALWSIISNITTGMFSTDRIAIDPQFGPELSCLRYRNWIQAEFAHQNTILAKVLYKKEHVGFMLLKIADSNLKLLLNGIYKPYQRKGIGLLTPASPLLYVKKNGLNYREVSTHISSNNVPVVKLYNRLNFIIDHQTYVFIKHTNL